jgi:hypothetical protein
MIFDYPAPRRDALRAALAAAHRSDETRCVDELLRQADLPRDLIQRIHGRARALVSEARAHPAGSGIEGFLVEYRLTSQEGTALMCLAESLLRVPDARTAEAFTNRDSLWPRCLCQSAEPSLSSPRPRYRSFAIPAPVYPPATDRPRCRVQDRFGPGAGLLQGAWGAPVGASPSARSGPQCGIQGRMGPRAAGLLRLVRDIPVPAFAGTGFVARGCQGPMGMPEGRQGQSQV